MGMAKRKAKYLRMVALDPKTGRCIVLDRVKAGRAFKLMKAELAECGYRIFGWRPCDGNPPQNES
jgi:hypothetical protein